MSSNSHDADKDPSAQTTDLETEPAPEPAQANPHEVADLVTRNIALRNRAVEMAKARAEQERSDFLKANGETPDRLARKGANTVTAVLIVVGILVVTGVTVGGIVYYLVQTGQF